MSNFYGFLELLKGPFKILSQNGRLMAIIAIIYLMLYSLSFILFTYTTNPFITDFVLKLFSLPSARPGTPEYTNILISIRDDIGIFLGIEGAYAIFYFFVVVFAQTSVIIIASCYYNGNNNLSFNELMLKVSKTWSRPFVTLFYIHLLAGGYSTLFFLPFLVPTLVLFDHRVILVTVLTLLAILFITFYIYLSVVWSLAVVVSVNEDTYGLLALGKARELVKGNRVPGFFLNFLCLLVMGFIFVFGSKLSPSMPIIVGNIEFICIGLVSMFQFMAYSGFYYQCKNNTTKSRGLEYSQIPTAVVLSEDIP
uniref:uncharacterized protein LOC122600902 n=1 Tax=Erigeron canadensis TaxID=72917 RepID=UPI001CB95AA6|nr:uncharacterized protein LOC122600902 [Erigeron canadensis]